jgi:PEP-CTERM motif
MHHRLILATIISLALPSTVFAQFVVSLDPATARFTYFPPSFGPGIPGGVPNEYELHFGMQGMFTMEELPNNQGDITQADLVLLGNDAAFQSDPAGRAQVQETARQILLNTVFTAEHGPPLDRTVFRGDVSGPDLVIEFFRSTLVRMEGGPDIRPVDGPGYQYTYPIPEPSTVALLLAGCVFAMVWRLKSRSMSSP